MKTSISIVAGLMAAAIAAPASATSVSFNGASADVSANVTILEDFESYAAGTPGAAIGPNAFVYNDSVSGASARPAYGSTGNFATVLTGGSYTIAFGPTNFFAFIV